MDFKSYFLISILLFFLVVFSFYPWENLAENRGCRESWQYAGMCLLPGTSYGVLQSTKRTIFMWGFHWTHHFLFPFHSIKLSYSSPFINETIIEVEEMRGQSRRQGEKLLFPTSSNNDFRHRFVINTSRPTTIIAQLELKASLLAVVLTSIVSD